jgi:signal transduction histidine kinase/putative methionine-R-sulfoxide reductase with GAF domain
LESTLITRGYIEMDAEAEIPQRCRCPRESESTIKTVVAAEVYEEALAALQQKLGIARAEAVKALLEVQQIMEEGSAAEVSPPLPSESALHRQVSKRRRAERHIRRQAQTTKALVRTASRLNAQLDMEAVLVAVCEETAAALDVPYATVSLYDPETKAFHLARSYGLPDGFDRTAEPLPLALYESYREQWGSPIVVPDVQELADLPNQEWHARLEIRTTASAGMVRDNELIGRLNVASRRVRRFRKQELALLQGLADQAALAIVNAREVRERKKAEEALVKEKRRLELLYNLSQNLAMSLKPREVGNRALDGIMTLSGAQRGEMLMLDGDGEHGDHRFRLVAVSGYDRKARPLLDARAEVHMDHGLPGHVVQTRTAVLAGDVRQHQAWQPLPELDDAVASAVAVPLMAAGELVGVLMLLDERPYFFGVEHLAMLEAAAKPIALSLQNARLYEAEYQARQEADRLRMANLALSEPLDVRTLLETLLDELRSLVSYDKAAVLLLDSEARLVRRAYRNHRQPAASLKAADTAIDLDRAPELAELLADQRSLLVPVTTGYTQWNRGIGMDGEGSWLAVPLLVDGNCIGAFTLAKSEPHFFTTTHLRLVETMAAQAAIAIHNARRYDQAFMGREQLRGLTHQVVTAQEDERHRISYQLHDETGQALSALQINLSLIRDDLGKESAELRRRLDDAIDLTASTIEHIRSLADNLHPPALNVVGLNLTLHNLCRSFTARTYLSVEYRGADLPQLSHAYRIVFYRLLQEALTNVLKHAQARKVDVSLDYDGRHITLNVADDGRGFDPEAIRATTGQPGNIGLFGLQERFARLGGQLTIKSQPGKGACLIARAPWQETA